MGKKAFTIALEESEANQKDIAHMADGLPDQAAPNFRKLLSARLHFERHADVYTEGQVISHA